MITIPISKQNLFSVLIALLFASAEILLLSALLNLVNVYVTRYLFRSTTNRPLPIRLYRSLILISNFCSILIFLILDILISLTAVPSTRPVIASSRCLKSSLPRAPNTSDPTIPGAEALHFACVTVDNITVSHTPGNRSLSSYPPLLQCEDTDVYRYTIGSEIMYTDDLGELVYGCQFEVCGALLWRPDETGEAGMLYFSPPISKSSKNIPLRPTKVFRDGNRIEERLQEMANILPVLYKTTITAEGEIRRILLTGVEEGECKFEVGRKEVTVVKLWAAWVMGVIWTTSVIIGIIGMWGCGKVLFDMGNGEHWAQRTRYGLDSRQEGQMGIQYGEDGLVWVVSV